MNNHTVTLFADDVRNIVGTLLKELAPLLALPARPPAPSERLNIIGGGFHSVTLHSAPAWRGCTRVTMVDDLITVEVLRDGDWVPAWRSDGQPIAAPRTGTSCANYAA
jgi:hypothetical protein